MIEVRDASLEDAGRILEIYAYYVKNTAITFEYEVPSVDEFRSRMERTMRKYPYLVILRDGVIEGYAYAGAFVGRAAYDWSCEMTIYLDHGARKCGMGRILYDALQEALRQMGICLHWLSRARGRVSDGQQRRISRAFGLQKGRRVLPLRVQIRSLVQYDMDGKAHRGPLRRAVACDRLS